MATQDIDLGVLARGPKGDKGDKGDTGPAGPQGPQGPKGDTNETATNALKLANSANDKLSAIQANGGGRNLVQNTDQDFVVDDTANTGTQGWCFRIFSLTQRLKVGDQITVSAEGTLSGRGNLSTYDAILYDPNTSFARSNSKRLTAGKRSSVTLEVNNLNGTGDTVLLIYAGNIADTEGKKNIIHHLMVEKGTVAHDWQLALEDIQSQIDANSTAIKNVKTAAANAQSTADSAQNTANTAKSTADSALSKANSNATALNNKANKSDLTWANISGKPSIPSTFNSTISDTSTDFNSLTSEGHYCIDISPSYQGKNGPNQSDWGLLDVKVAGRMIVQTYYSDTKNEVYVRNRRDGTTWTAWREITFWS